MPATAFGSEVPSQQFLQIVDTGTTISVHHRENIQMFPIRIDALEFFHRLSNPSNKPIDRWISNALLRCHAGTSGSLLQIRLNRISVSQFLYLAVKLQNTSSVHREIWCLLAGNTHFRFRKALRPKSQTRQVIENELFATI